MIHNYPYTDFHELNLDYLMKLARESMGLHFEQADKFLKLVNAQGQEVSRAKIYYAETALKDDLGNNIDAYIISTSLQGDNIIFTKGNGEYTTVTIPYAVKASKDVNNVDLTSYIHGLSVAGDKLLITYGNGETASITVPYAVKASTDENGKSITTYVADLSTGNNKLIVKDGDGTTIAELTIPYATSALNDVDGDAIKSTYGTDLTTDTTTVQLRSKDGAIISTITVPYATKALSDDQGNNFRSNYGYNLAVDGNKVALESHDGTTLNEITVPFATLATDATNAIESVSISGDEIVFTTYGGNSYRITSPYAVKALKDNLNNTITTTYVASVTNDPDTGEISFFASDGSLISTLIPTLDSAIHDSYGNLIGDFVKEIIVNPQNNYVVVNHGTGDSDTLTINYATHAYKDTYDNVIGNTYIRSLSIITDPSDNKKYLVAYNGELSELFRIALDDLQPGDSKSPIIITFDTTNTTYPVNVTPTMDGDAVALTDLPGLIDAGHPVYLHGVNSSVGFENYAQFSYVGKVGSNFYEIQFMVDNTAIQVGETQYPDNIVKYSIERYTYNVITGQLFKVSRRFTVASPLPKVLGAVQEGSVPMFNFNSVTYGNRKVYWFSCDNYVVNSEPSYIDIKSTSRCFGWNNRKYESVKNLLNAGFTYGNVDLYIYFYDVLNNKRYELKIELTTDSASDAYEGVEETDYADAYIKGTVTNTTITAL